MNIGKVNGYFFQFDNTLHTRIFLRITDLEVLDKGLKRSFARKQFGRVDWDGKFSGESGKKSTSALAYFDQYQLLG